MLKQGNSEQNPERLARLLNALASRVVSPAESQNASAGIGKRLSLKKSDKRLWLDSVPAVGQFRARLWVNTIHRVFVLQSFEKVLSQRRS